MARIRTVKPDFWTDDAITECSLSARLLFIGTWNFADDYGNLDRSAKQIKSRVFPIDNVDCEPLIQELIAHGLLTEYSVSDKKYLHIKGFANHQVINRPSKPSCPAYDDSLSTHGGISDDSRRKGREGKGRGRNERPSTKTQIPENFAISERVMDWAAKRSVANLQAHFENFVSASKAKGYAYADWDEALMNAIRNDWAKIGKGAPVKKFREGCEGLAL
jgi:hypothetical protein